MAKTRITLPTSKNLTDEERAIQIMVYWEELEEYSIEEVEWALKMARGKLKFFPVPADLIGFIESAKREEFRYPQIEYTEPIVSPERAKELLAEIEKVIGPVEPRGMVVKRERKITAAQRQSIEDRKLLLKGQANTLKN